MGTPDLASRMMKLKERRADLNRQLAEAEANVALLLKQLKADFAVADVAAAEELLQVLQKKVDRAYAALDKLEDTAERLVEALENNVK